MHESESAGYYVYQHLTRARFNRTLHHSIYVLRIPNIIHAIFP